MSVVIPPGPSTIRELIQRAVAQLGQVTDRPHAEAERLIASALQVERTAVLAHPEWLLTSAQVDEFVDAVRRRASGTPLPYLLGYIEFCGLTFRVTPAVLIPRPETELLVELAQARLGALRQGIVVDVGTGSGCIAVTLAIAEPRARIWATDISAPALAVARQNARDHGVGERVRWLQADLLAPFAGPIGLIVSNPPYVAEAEWWDLPPSVKQEPRTALISGPEGLNAIRPLLQQAATRLAPGGSLLMEIGEQQASAVTALAQSAFDHSGRRVMRLQVYQDLAGKDRVLEVALTRPANQTVLH
ncbi:MAG: peptide chain release factor N(5)-glutamine methyltransferase [Anaerolineae bacterium]|nr:peptide chain release factor N(5)-glutamine methyltransferase [Anaerolineae bacterium]